MQNWSLIFSIFHFSSLTFFQFCHFSLLIFNCCQSIQSPSSRSLSHTRFILENRFSLSLSLSLSLSIRLSLSLKWTRSLSLSLSNRQPQILSFSNQFFFFPKFSMLGIWVSQCFFVLFMLGIWVSLFWFQGRSN